MTNVTEIDMNELMRQEDGPLMEFVKQWERARHKFLAAEPGKKGELSDRIEELEGRIIRYVPTTFLGLALMLGMAHTIVSTREVDPDSYVAHGSASALIARAIVAVDRVGGIIGE